MKERETRTWTLTDWEVREAEAGAAPEIVGYAAVFDSLSEDLGGFRERVAPGAFARSIATNDIRALWGHDDKYVLGRNRAGTLGLAEDARGLRVEIAPPATTWAADLMRSMARGDVNQMSFGFYVRDEAWEDVDGVTVRTLRDVDLFDVSVVTYPAYPATSAEARDRAAAMARAGQAGDEAERARTRARRAARRREIEILGEMVK